MGGVKIVARRLIETVDPDGVLRDVEYRDRRRSLVIHQRADGSVVGTFDGTAEFGELLLTTLDVLAAPKPAADGTPDLRSAEQRNHDGLADAMRLMIRSAQLPPANEVLATVVLTMTETQWRTEQGLARTGHGALIPVAEAKRIAGGETRLLPVVLADTGPPPTHWLFKSARSIHAYGTCHRIVTERERLTMAARDGGCTFPGCTVVGAERRASLLVRPRRRPTVERAKRAITVPAAWCEADHITNFSLTGRTSVDDGHLLCPHHHREKDRHGWQVLMINAIPHWLAPAWLDPEQVPRRNHAHDPVGVG